MRLRRDIVLIAILAVVALVFGWFLLLNRPGAAIEAFENGARARAEAARPKPAAADQFRATVCAASPCLLVEAGGLAFVFGAGKGAAEGIVSHGLMRADIDAVVLADLSLEAIAGLPELAIASHQAGRLDPLIVYGPRGVLTVVDGANLMLSARSEAKLVVGAEGEDQGLEGLVVFDSGVVTIRSFGEGGPSAGRVHRIDFGGKSLVVAGCSARSVDIVAASRGTRQVSAVLAAGSSRLLKADAASVEACLDSTELGNAISGAKLSAVLIAPIYPSADLADALRAWNEIVAADAISGRPAGPGSVIDLSGETPTVRLNQ